MKNIYLIIILICFSSVILTGCNNNESSNKDYAGVHINNEVYQPLNSDDIEKFIQENNIDPLSVDTIYGYNTVFIFRDLNTSGYYEVTKQDGVVTEGRKAFATGDWSELRSIVFSGGTASGAYPFSVLYILDDELVNKGYIIEIIGVNDTIKIEIAKKSYAVETNKIGSIVGYRVLNSRDEVIIDESRK